MTEDERPATTPVPPDQPVPPGAPPDLPTALPPDLLALLEDVAAGRVDPQEAVRRLDSISPPAWSSTPPPDHDPPTLLRVDLGATTLTLVADPAVATISVSGPHALTRDGSTLRLSAAPVTGPEEGTYAVRPAPSPWQKLAAWPGKWGNAELTVRVNPDLDVDVSMTAGVVKSLGGVRLRTVRIGAGSLEVEGQRSPLDVSVTAGSAVVHAEPTFGTWRLSVQGGSLRLVLGAGSSARIRASARLSDVDGLPGPGERVVGAGAASVEINATAADVVVAESAQAPR